MVQYTALKSIGMVGEKNFQCMVRSEKCFAKKLEIFSLDFLFKKINGRSLKTLIFDSLT